MSAKAPLQESETVLKKEAPRVAGAQAGAVTVSAAWHRLTPRSVLQLQRVVGNRYVTRLLQRRAEEDEQRSATGAVARGGLPETLRAGIETLSGMDMSAVQVHRNSDDARKVNALAYAQGNDIHLAPGQEQHLAHEAWHVVQQRQGRVQPTGTVPDGRALNDDPGLESEADRMGAKAMQLGSVQRLADDAPLQAKRETLQRQESEQDEEEMQEMQMKRDPLQRQESDEDEDEMAL